MMPILPLKIYHVTKNPKIVRSFASNQSLQQPLKSPFPDLDIPKVNILSYIFPHGEELPDTPLWIDAADDSISLSLRQLQVWCKRVAIGLDRLGIKPGSVVLVYTTNHVFVPAAYMGIVGSGRIFSGANPAYTLPEIVYQIKNTEAAIVLVHPSFLKIATAAVKEAGMTQTRIYQFSDVLNVPKDGIKDWREMLGSEEEAKRYTIKEFSPEEATRTVASLNYSSGTTGVLKGVCISHHALISNVAQSIFMKDLYKTGDPKKAPEQRWVGFLPLYHAFGQLWTMSIAAKLRITVYVMKQFVLTDFLDVIQTRRITHFQAAPPVIVMLSKRPEVAKYDLSSVEDVLCGAAPLSKELQNDVANRFHIRICQGWGMTEVTCAGTIMPGGIDDDTGSVGMILPNCEAKLLDEDNREVGMGERGELYLRGPNVCLGYWRNEQATKECLDFDGWLRSGDVALYNKDGWFWIVDRKKELIKVNGLQVAPAELEAVLLTHLSVADAAVVGIPLHGEEWPRAYIVLKANSKTVTPESIQSWIKEHVAKHKWLVGGVAFVDEIPKLASGKITRKIMREWARKDVVMMEKRNSARL